MNLISLLADMLGGATAQALQRHGECCTELRLRIGQPAVLRLQGGACVRVDPIDAETLHRLLNRLMHNSLYAREQELRRGYFTADGGCRVGVCGQADAGVRGIGSLAGISSACIRFPRQVHGCASELAKTVLEHGLASLLILSPPGLGKTTLLRDLVRIVSEAGYNACVADERREIAACISGLPQMNLGPNTDVLDGLDKIHAVPMLVRGCAPDVIAVDELGSSGDAEAILDARRCGTAVFATAHAASLQDALSRSGIGGMITGGAFDFCAVLGPKIGKIKFLHACAKERLQHAEGFLADHHTFELHGGGQGDFQSAQAPL